jgi:exocyst complex component 5
MCAICDVNEYRKSVRVLSSPLVVQLFDILHALCNLLLVKHENLQEVCGGETLVSFSFYATPAHHLLPSRYYVHQL